VHLNCFLKLISDFSNANSTLSETAVDFKQVLPTPVGILAAVRLRLDDVVDLSAPDGCIVIVPIRTPAPNNADMLAAITPEN